MIEVGGLVMSKAMLVVSFVLMGAMVARAEAEPEAAPAAPPQQIYKYKTKDGRTVYTNILDEVPPEQRVGGKVDLSKVALNTQVGNDINGRLAAEHAQLSASPYCKELEKVASKTAYEQLWDDHAPLIVCGGLIALLILMTPTMMRNVNPPDWAKVLSKAIPTLFVLGGAMYGMTAANKMALEARSKLKPCLNETFESLGGSANPAAERLSMIDQLKRDIQKYQDVANARTTALEGIAKQQ
jgi:hypothetical protein